jgi:polyisoprenyl-teichoic acid--peptidoglycan teichoic acid transferase
VVVGVLLVLLIAIGAGVAIFAMSWVRGSLATPGIAPALPSNTQPSENVTYSFGQLLPRWSGNQRITVLLMGIDERAQETGPFRTDTLMLLTLDPSTMQAGVLSVPRDLWVPIPGYRDGRINTAHFLGDLHDYPGGGPALAVETLEYNLGTPINHYVRVNFHAFVVLVNQVGGIDVFVETAIDDPLYPDYHYGYDPLYIEAGWHHFDGEMALKYARTRHSSNDFDRARRQQQVISAILERVTSYELLPDLARNAPSLYQTLQDSVVTDLALDQILALANLAVDVDQEHIRYGVIDHTSTQPYVTADGAQVLIPLRDRMREVRDYVFESVPPAPVVEEATAVIVPTPTLESAAIAVLNGTMRGGLAGSTGDYLRDQGFTVLLVGNADRQDYANTRVVMNRNKPQTLGRLLNALNLTSAAAVQGQEPESDYDLVLILGNDFQLP